MKKHKGDWKYTPLSWLLHGLAWLPWWAIYALSSACAAILYHVVRYRRRLVASNLAKCFPEMTDAERRHTARQFYRRFTDVAFEAVKQLHMSRREMHRRMEFVGTEDLERMIDEGRSVAVYFSHCGNWEWATSVTLHMPPFTVPAVAYGQVYRPLRNEWFDAFMLRLRCMWGAVSYPKKTVLRTLLMLRKEGKISVTGFMSDQKPSHGDPTRVVEFLNRPTAMITGTETLGRKLGMAAVYWDMERLRRGYYRITMRLMTPDMSAEPEGAVTDQYASLLQATIRRDPPCWLWTHNRWKNPVNHDSCNNSELERREAAQGVSAASAGSH